MYSEAFFQHAFTLNLATVMFHIQLVWWW